MFPTASYKIQKTPCFRDKFQNRRLHESLETTLKFFPNFVELVELELETVRYHSTCNHSKICHNCVCWLTVADTNLGAQAAKERIGQAGTLNIPAEQAPQRFHQLHDTWRQHAPSTFSFQVSKCPFQHISSFVKCIFDLVGSHFSFDVDPGHTPHVLAQQIPGTEQLIGRFRAQELNLFPKRLQVVRAAPNQGLTSPVFLDNEFLQKSLRLLRVLCCRWWLRCPFCLGGQ